MYEAPNLACGFVQGNNVSNGPPVKFYDTIDHAAWLLSEDSKWLPTPIRDALTRGIAGWGVKRNVSCGGSVIGNWVTRKYEPLSRLSSTTWLRVDWKKGRTASSRPAWAIRCRCLPRRMGRTWDVRT